MTTLLFSQPIPDTSVSENSHTQNSVDTAAVASPNESRPISADEFRLAADVLQLADLQHNTNANMFIRQTVSAQYKKVSEDLNPEKTKRKIRKKSLKDLMQESFFHGAYWLGSTNFIA